MMHTNKESIIIKSIMKKLCKNEHTLKIKKEPTKNIYI